jgi:hypothetical protein
MGLKPLNMTVVIAGFLMVTMNLAVLGPMATSAVPGAVEDAVETKAKDDICENVLCTEVNDDWKESTSQRDFYAWHMWNVEDVVNNYSEPLYEKIGPVTYDVTLKKEVESYDIKNGLLTYKQTTSYACAKDTAVPCSTEVSQLNIAFNPQVVGATGTAINEVMKITKVGFASGVIDIHFKQVSAAHNVSDYNLYNIESLEQVEGNYPGAVVNTDLGNTAESYFLDGMFELVDEAYGDAFLDDDTKTYLGEGGVIPQWAEGTWDDDGDGILEEDEVWIYDQFTGEYLSGDVNNNSIQDIGEISSFVPLLNLDYTFNHAVGPDGENISLFNYMGPLVYAAMGEPETIEEIQADPENSVTLERAELWDFTHPTDLNITLARDWTLYGGMGKLMLDNGADDDNYLTNDDEDAVNLSQRFEWLMDLEIENDVARTLLTLGDGTDEPLGILAESESGTSFGMSEFLDMSRDEAKEIYGIDNKQHTKVKQFCNDWVGDVSALPLILVGNEGYITASEFVNQTFGSINPIDDTYMEYSLNAGGMWGSGILGFPAGESVDLTQNQSANMLFGQYGLTTQEGAGMFLYGELSGKSIPINFTTGELSEAQDWTNETVASIYGIDENAAGAARLLLMEIVFKDFVPQFLIDSFGTSRYLTQSVDNWLLGWHDPVNAYLYGDGSDDMTAGWTSLESNETYFGSSAYVEGGIPTGDPDKPYLITMCTGETDTCDKGETVMVGDSEYVGWKSVEKETATFGLITAEVRGETTGGFITGEGDLIDLSGYGTAEVNCDKEGTLKGIPVDICTAYMDPVTRPIQAKLINSGDLLDATPGALPVYFGSEVEVKVEQLSGAIIAGKSESTFWLDTRLAWEQQTPPTMDNLQEVFVIKTEAELDDETAETMESQIVTNQDYFTYWTNFDTDSSSYYIDQITAAFYILGLICLLAGGAMIFKEDSEESHSKTKWTDLTQPEPMVKMDDLPSTDETMEEIIAAESGSEDTGDDSKSEESSEETE